ALALLPAEPGAPDDLVFPGLSAAAMRQVVERMGSEVDVHGFRSSFRDWAAETGEDRDCAEMALSHTVGNAVERAYRRSDMFARRIGLAERWARFCTTPESARGGDNVRKLPPRRA